jgi:predicted PurR-regulated permease PerM
MTNNMTNNMTNKWIPWAAGAVLVLFAYATKGILLPFLVGLAIAYLLDPLADRLEALKVPRWLAAGTILILFFLALIGIGIAIFPLLKSQIAALIQSLPGYFAAIRPFFAELWQRLGDAFPAAAAYAQTNFVEQGLQRAFETLEGILASFWSGGRAIFNLLTLLLIAPVVAFFLLRDWDRIIAKADALLPKRHAATVRAIGRDVDESLGGFVRGQTLAAVIMATLYAVGWSLAGLEFALILGLIGGIMAYIPYAGALFTFFLAMVIALGQFGLDWPNLLMVAGVYAVVQIIEAAVLTPYVVGSRVRLHPVWVLFAIFAGGELMGFVCVLIAVPLAAAVGVLVRHFLASYMQSPLHQGKGNVRKKSR